MLRIFYFFVALFSLASCLSDEDKPAELEKFNRLKARLYNLNYDVAANFCDDGVYSPANLPHPHFQERTHRYITLSLIKMKERYYKAGWDVSEFFCRGWKPADIEDHFKRNDLQNTFPRTKLAKVNVIQKLYELLREDDYFRSLMSDEQP